MLPGAPLDRRLCKPEVENPIPFGLHCYNFLPSLSLRLPNNFWSGGNTLPYYHILVFGSLVLCQLDLRRIGATELDKQPYGSKETINYLGEYRSERNKERCNDLIAELWERRPNVGSQRNGIGLRLVGDLVCL